MKSTIKAVMVAIAVVAAGLVSGCGGGGGVTAPAASGNGSPSSPSASPSAGATPDGAALYTANCAGCHGALATSAKTGITLARLQAAISNNTAGMGSLSTLTAAQQQAIVTALTPASTTPTPTPTVDGAALYAANCAGCHGALATSGKIGVTLARLQTAISNNTAGMGSLSTLSAAQQQAIVTALAPASTTPTPPPPPTTDGVALYAANCAGCHGALATSGKIGVTLARLQTAISNNTGGMGSFSTLSAAQQQAIVTALAPSATTPPPPAVTDGPTLYATYCVSCHGALATSTKGGATTTRIQTAINTNAGGVMGSLAALTSTQVSAIATALAGVTATPVACGSCHAIPPATGKHAKHAGQKIVCATCHGSGYSTTTVNAATHNNGVKNLTTTIGWNATNRSCSNSCHGTHSW